jgi:hypothetical protein
MKLASILALLVASTALAFAIQDPKPAPHAPPVQGKPASAPAPTGDAALVRAQLPTYPLSKCPISDHALDAEAVDVVVDGTLVRLCCADCKGPLEKDPAPAVQKVKDAVVAQQKPGYPLKGCVLSDKPLDDKAKDVVVGTRYLATCCGKCAGKVIADPAPFLEKANAAYVAAQKPSYPTKNCIVMDEPLDPETQVDYLYGLTLFELCCEDCIEELQAEPATYLAKLEKARAAAKPAAPAGK